MDIEKRIVTRPGHRLPFGSDGRSVQYLDQANIDTKIITTSVGVIADSDVESLNALPMSHTTDANKMQRNSDWIATQSKIFEHGDSSMAKELFLASENSILDCLNCKKFPEANPWDWMAIEYFIQVAKHAIVCIANAYHADAERLILSVESPENLYRAQLLQKIESAKPEKIRLTKKAAAALLGVAPTTLRKMVKAGEYGLEEIIKTRCVLMHKSEYDRLKVKK